MTTRDWGAVLFIWGCLLNATPWAAAAQDPVQAEEGIRLDFQDVDLRLVISALAEAGNLNVVYADLPQRSVTLRMARPIPQAQVIDILRSLATSNGLAVEEDGALIRVMGNSGVGPVDEGEVEDPAPEESLRLFVHRLRHARAPVLAATLQSLFGGGQGGPSGTGREPLRSFSESMRDQGVDPFEPDGPPVDVELGTQAVSFRGELTGTIQIVPDETTNSLLVRATPTDWATLLQAIEALDLRPLQVLIEVVIAEVRRTSDLRLGVSARGENEDGQGVDTSLELQGNSAGDFVLDIMRFGDWNVNALIGALASSGDVRIVSRPVILAQNNQQARILIGDERPFIQVFRTLPTDEAVRDQVVQYRDVGTSLTLIPTINSDGYINLDLVQEVNTATSEEQFGAPVISTREAATQLFVRDGQTAVIGGLVDQQQIQAESGIPLLKDIPLLGNLFKSTSTETSESELFLFLTPHIISTDIEADELLENLSRQSEMLRPDTMQLSILRDSLTVPDTIGAGPAQPAGADTLVLPGARFRFIPRDSVRVSPIG